MEAKQPDQMVREALQVTEVAIKLSALGIKNALGLIAGLCKRKSQGQGQNQP